jgi:hypothetical protein
MPRLVTKTLKVDDAFCGFCRFNNYLSMRRIATA